MWGELANPVLLEATLQHRYKAILIERKPGLLSARPCHKNLPEFLTSISTFKSSALLLAASFLRMHLQASTFTLCKRWAAIAVWSTTATGRKLCGFQRPLFC